MSGNQVVFKCRVGDRALVVGIAVDGAPLDPVEFLGHCVVVAKPCVRDGQPAWQLRKPVAFTVASDKFINRKFYRAGHRLLVHHIADAALQPIRGEREKLMREKASAA